MSDTESYTNLKPITTVAKTDCYELLYQQQTNRIYFTIIGFWKNAAVVPDVVKDLSKALTLVQKGFSLLADMSAMVTHPQELNTLHIQLQIDILSAGLAYGAYVAPIDKIANFQVEQTMHDSQIDLKRFCTCQEAEDWLKSASGV